MIHHNETAPRPQSYSWRSRFLLFGLVMSMVPVFFASRSVFQTIAQVKDTKNKIITKVDFTNPSMKEPVEIVEMRSNGKPIKLDESFTDDDWFKDLTIKFKNVSDRPITYLNWHFLFPETASAGEPFGFPSSYNMVYGLTRALEREGAEGGKALMPGETDQIALDAKGFAKLRGFVGKRIDLRETTTARLTLLVAQFSDGDHWSSGDLWRPDPARPGKSILVKDKQ